MKPNEQFHLGQLLLEEVGVGNLPGKGAFLQAVQHTEDAHCLDCRRALEDWWPLSCSDAELAYQVFDHLTSLAEFDPGDSAEDNETLAPLVNHSSLCSGCQERVDTFRAFLEDIAKAPIPRNDCRDPSLRFVILFIQRGQNLSKLASAHLKNCRACKETLEGIRLASSLSEDQILRLSRALESDEDLIEDPVG